MIIGKKSKIILILFLLLSGRAYADNNFQLPALFSLFSVKSDVKMNFVQQRYFNFTDKPVTSKGFLVYRKPDYLAQEILQPERRSYIADGDWSIVKADQKVISKEPLKSSPNLMLFTNTLKYVLSGDLTKLQANFNLSLSGKKEDWILNLVPKKNLGGNIHDIQITGKESIIEAMAVHYRNGDLLALSLQVRPA